MSRFVAAIDQGTTSTRCMIFDHGGQVIASDQREHRQIYPQPGWVEHDPEEIWQRTCEVIRAALRSGGLTAGDLVAVGVTNQRETTVVWNRYTGQAISNALVWQDTRTAPLVEELTRAGGQDRFRARTGLPLATYFSGTKIAWLLDNVAGARAAAEAGDLIFGTIDTFLTWRLTGGPRGGVHVTDVTNASRTMLMDLTALDWDEEILRILGIPRAMLPRIMPSSAVYGHAVDPLEGAPVAGLLGDQQAAMVGQTCFAPGEAKNTYGTGSFLLLNTGTRPVASRHGLLTTVGYQFGDAPAVYALEGSIAITGALVQWLRDNLGLITSAAEVEALASLVEDSGGVYIVPAFSGLFAPYWRSDARGVIVGLTRYANKSHLARAALEATAYQVRDVTEAMEQDSGVRLSALKVDGGMAANNLLMQFQADILNVPVVRPRVIETTALGAAYAAGLAAGYWRHLDELRANWSVDRTWHPQMDDARRERLYRGWKKAVVRTFEP
ncbi:MAG: glycerol kinase GlpK [Oscillochloridaceae bacterium]|nr:glycerol kinase GlpK [Chloroflexaceae bacterium]MDW8389633.1 glycerol kinase GlpK [Oscillochloridaceae bacterium]